MTSSYAILKCVYLRLDQDMKVHELTVLHCRLCNLVKGIHFNTGYTVMTIDIINYLKICVAVKVNEQHIITK